MRLALTRLGEAERRRRWFQLLKSNLNAFLCATGGPADTLSGPINLFILSISLLKLDTYFSTFSFCAWIKASIYAERMRIINIIMYQIISSCYLRFQWKCLPSSTCRDRYWLHLIYFLFTCLPFKLGLVTSNDWAQCRRNLLR